MKNGTAVKNTEMAILVLVVAACAMPFLDQPFHMDDGFYLDMARNAQSHPLFPNDTPYMFQGIYWSDLGSHSHPTLQTYFLAAIMHFFGEGPGKERIYHLFALAYPILAVLSFYWICARFVERPLWPAMLLACSPLFLVIQHTLMTDVPMLAFWLAAISSFLWATHSRRPVLYGCSTVFQVAAVFTSYQSLALAPLLGFYHLRQGRGWKVWLSLAVAPMAISSWYLANCVHYGRPLWEKTLGYVGSRSPLAPEVLGTKLLSILEYQGWLVIFPFFILYLLARGLKWRLLMLAVLGAVCLAQSRVPEYGWIDKGIFVVGAAAGIFAAIEMSKLAWRAFSAPCRDNRAAGEQFLALWYFGYFAYCLFFLTEGSARYILPMLPPFILCYFRALEQCEVSEYRFPRRRLNAAMLASGSVAVSLVWGLVLSRADMEFAEIYPRLAADFHRVAGNLKSYSRGEWGFRYYLGRVGAQALPADSSLVRGGSVIALPRLALPSEIPADLRSISIPVQSILYKPDTRLRVLDWCTPAAFWSTGWGLIPFSLSGQPLENVEILQTSFMAERLPWARIETASGLMPWPGYVDAEGKAFIAILAKPGTSIRYGWPVKDPVQLTLLCGVSSDSFQNGSDRIFEFEIRQVGEGGRILAEQRIALRPGRRDEDRAWQPVRLNLVPASEGILDFRYNSDADAPQGTGAFAQALLLPFH
jgi:4-amino-4-deoxy-L-arabinose transferase-like glycosyltransferase